MSTSDGYIEITVTVPKESEEPVCNFLIDHISGGNGLILEDVGEDISIRLYVDAEQDSDTEINKISRFISDSGLMSSGDSESRISSKRIKNLDWIEVYKNTFEPVTVGDVVVKAVWTPDEFPGKLVITIEPKMAFGTGKHETTQLCIAAVRANVTAGDRVLDLGTGSGILAILAARLGASEIYGLDIDPYFRENAIENAELNHVGEIITFERGSMEKVDRTDYYDVVISNLIKEGIVELFDSFVAACKPGGMLILSGIRTDQIDDMNAFFAEKGFVDCEITTLNEWACYVIKV